MNTPSADSLFTLEVLRMAVANALERKRRLGQYAVIWKDNQPFIINPGTEQPALLREAGIIYRNQD